MKQNSTTLPRLSVGSKIDRHGNAGHEGKPFPGVIDLVANVLDEKQKIATLAILCDLAMSDGVLAGQEKQILQMYMDKFGVSEAKLSRLSMQLPSRMTFPSSHNFFCRIPCRLTYPEILFRFM